MRLVICGDMSVTEESAAAFEVANAKKAFDDILEVFNAADRVIVNLECTLTESEGEIKKFGPCLKAPLNTALTLKRAGVTDCALSNNHIFDFGIKGLNDTINSLEECELLYTGIGENYEDSRKNHIIEADGVSVAIINVCEHEYSYATENRIGTRPFDEFETMQDIREAKKANDYVIVIYHGGKERCRYPSPRLRKACREMVYCGADVVLCQHSHIIGCYEKFEDAHILYGQGNFHFIWSDMGEDWLEGLIVGLDIDKGKLDIDFIPVVVNGEGIELAKGERKQKILSDMGKRNAELLSGEWKEHWVEFCKSNADIYKQAICGYSIDDDEDATQWFSHYLECEAHRDVWMELFPTWNKTNEI